MLKAAQDHYTLLKEYNYAFARMMLCDPNAFNQLVIQSSPALNMPVTQVFEGLLDQWWAKVISCFVVLTPSLLIHIHISLMS